MGVVVESIICCYSAGVGFSMCGYRDSHLVAILLHTHKNNPRTVAFVLVLIVFLFSSLALFPLVSVCVWTALWEMHVIIICSQCLLEGIKE